MGKELRIPRTYRSEAPPKIELKKLETRYVGGDASGFDWPASRTLGGGGEKIIPERDAPVEMTLTFRCNAEAARRMAEFFGLYGQGAAWDERAPEGMRLGAGSPEFPRLLAADVGKARALPGPDDVVDAEFDDE